LAAIKGVQVWPLAIMPSADLVLLGKLASGADDFIDQRRKVHAFGVQFELTGLDLRQVKHLINEAKEMGASGIDALERLQRLLDPELSRRPGPLRSFCAQGLAN
jgi:hypothetical protein